ncbi:hypothetical protein IB292_02585 [Vibrio parahaemolyticus]|uniref:Uncharacterized protein n=1 Tax=Vibrio parahaemolyticus TaxID=670 RepID=A0A9Q3UAW9_VIBPH|nr:hypothetical protein [Vibrio parahaemolyticus]MCC3803916.1 hypothetical protein [Vibrio parahaemolyticus]
MNLTHLNQDTITSVTQKLQNHLLFIRKKEINDHNISVIKEFSYTPKGKAQLVAPLMEILGNNGMIEVDGIWEALNGDHTDKSVQISFGTFTVELQWQQYESSSDGTTLEGQTCVLTSSPGIDDRAVEVIETVFSDFAPQYIYNIVHAAEFSLYDTPQDTDLITEEFEHAAKFFNTFGEMSGYYRCLVEIQCGEHRFIETYLVEANDAIEAEVFLYQFLEEGPNGIIEQNGTYLASNTEKGYLNITSQALPKFDFEQVKGVHRTVSRSDIEKPTVIQLNGNESKVGNETGYHVQLPLYTYLRFNLSKYLKPLEEPNFNEKSVSKFSVEVSTLNDELRSMLERHLGKIESNIVTVYH